MSLEQDYTTVPGQVFACLSIVGPECPQKNDKFGIKIRGTFANRDEAANHAKRLQKEDPTFDIYVVDMYKWLLIPPDSSKIEDVHYTNDKLEEIMTGYKENQAQAARMFNERKQGMVDKSGFAPVAVEILTVRFDARAVFANINLRPPIRGMVIQPEPRYPRSIHQLSFHLKIAVENPLLTLNKTR